ncbi:MAG TPA: DAHL domain-containing protein [Burkholderiaceae bacterium]|nr:DAHL domain-containing protein [Burkholderiaceae bacterium]
MTRARTRVPVRPRRPSSGLVMGAIGLVLVAVLALLVVKARRIDADAHGDVLVLLRQLKQVDAEWNADVLRIKTGLHIHYDALTQPLPMLLSAQRALQDKAAHLWGAQGAEEAVIRQLLASSRQVLDQKMELTERFKSHHSILRNSSRYLPTAAAEALNGLDALAPAARQPVARAVREVLTRTFEYLSAPEPLQAVRVKDGLDRLREVAASLPAAAVASTAVFAVHVETVLKQEEECDQLLAALSALPLAACIDDLGDAVARRHATLLAAQRQDRWLLVGYCLLLLLAVLAAMAWRLVRLKRDEVSRAAAKLKESQMQLVQSAKMAALGQMVAGIAHEINIPLAHIKGTLELLGEQVQPVTELAARGREFALLMRDAQGRGDREQFAREFRQRFCGFEALSREVADQGVLEALDERLKEGLRCILQISELITGLKNFSGQERAAASEFSVAEGLESALGLARNLTKDRVEIRKDFRPVPKVQGAPSQIKQVFLNLITNAVQAMPANRVEPGILTLRVLMEGRDMVRVEVQDNGSGIPDDVLPRIFDPFFTTKDVGQGAGMGLCLSSRIVQEHDGKILVDSEPGVGTVFAVLLPVRSVQGKSPRSAAALVPA